MAYINVCEGICFQATVNIQNRYHEALVASLINEIIPLALPVVQQFLI